MTAKNHENFDPIRDALREARQMVALLQSSPEPTSTEGGESVLQALMCCERAIGGLRLAAELVIATDEFIHLVAYTVWGVVHVGHLEECTATGPDKTRCPHLGDEEDQLPEVVAFVERQLGKIEQVSGLPLAAFLAHVLASTPSPYCVEHTPKQLLSAFAQYLGETLTCAKLDETQDEMFGHLQRKCLPPVAPGALVELYAIAAMICEQATGETPAAANPTLN